MFQFGSNYSLLKQNGIPYFAEGKLCLKTAHVFTWNFKLAFSNISATKH